MSRRENAGEALVPIAETFSIRRLEGSRWRLRGTRSPMGFQLQPSYSKGVIEFPVARIPDSERSISKWNNTPSASEEASAKTHGRSVDTRSVRRASGFVLVAYTRMCAVDWGRGSVRSRNSTGGCRQMSGRSKIPGDVRQVKFRPLTPLTLNATDRNNRVNGVPAERD